MGRVAVGATLSAVLCLVTPAIGQDVEVSSLDISHNTVETESLPLKSAKPDDGYIVDVSGKRVRVVGARFLSDTSNGIEIFGRRQALEREAARSQIAAR
jgi:hypothetical protein